MICSILVRLAHSLGVVYLVDVIFKNMSVSLKYNVYFQLPDKVICRWYRRIP